MISFPTRRPGLTRRDLGRLLAGCAAAPVLAVPVLAAPLGEALAQGLSLDVRRGASFQPIPIAVTAFGGDSGGQVASVITNNFKRSVFLTPVAAPDTGASPDQPPAMDAYRALNAQYVLTGRSNRSGGRVQTEFRLWDVTSGAAGRPASNTAPTPPTCQARRPPRSRTRCSARSPATRALVRQRGWRSWTSRVRPRSTAASGSPWRWTRTGRACGRPHPRRRRRWWRRASRRPRRTSPSWRRRRAGSRGCLLMNLETGLAAGGGQRSIRHDVRARASRRTGAKIVMSDVGRVAFDRPRDTMDLRLEGHQRALTERAWRSTPRPPIRRTGPDRLRVGPRRHPAGLRHGRGRRRREAHLLRRRALLARRSGRPRATTSPSPSSARAASPSAS